MFTHDVVQILLRYIVTYFIHSRYYVFLCYITRIVSVKLVEDSLQLILAQELLNVQGCHQEFRVIDFIVTKVVNFRYYLVYLLVS